MTTAEDLFIGFNQIKAINWWLFDTRAINYIPPPISSGSSSASCSPHNEQEFFETISQYDCLVEPMLKERPFPCPYCSRCFSRRHDLGRHSRVHTGVKPYHCPCCQKSFARSDARGCHILSDPTCINHMEVQKLIQRRRGTNKRYNLF